MAAEVGVVPAHDNGHGCICSWCNKEKGTIINCCSKVWDKKDCESAHGDKGGNDDENESVD
jgi:hypothetical protein